MVDISTTFKCIGTRLGDGVEFTADEVSLTDIKRRDCHLSFFDSLDGDRTTTTGEVGTQTEVVVEAGTINRERSGTSVKATKCHTITTIGREAGKVGDVTCHSRQCPDLSIVDVGRGAHLLNREFRSPSSDHHLREFVGILRDPYVEIIGFSQLQGNTAERLILIADISHGHCIRSTRTHTLNIESAINVCHCGIACTGWLVHSQHRGTNDGLNTFAALSDLTTHT